jgi:hypothetical protein
VLERIWHVACDDIDCRAELISRSNQAQVIELARRKGWYIEAEPILGLCLCPTHNQERLERLQSRQQQKVSTS